MSEHRRVFTGYTGISRSGDHAFHSSYDFCHSTFIFYSVIVMFLFSHSTFVFYYVIVMFLFSHSIFLFYNVMVIFLFSIVHSIPLYLLVVDSFFPVFIYFRWTLMTAYLGGIRHGSLHSLHIHHLLNSWTCYYILFDEWIVIIGVLIVETIVLYALVELVNAHYSSYRFLIVLSWIIQ